MVVSRESLEAAFDPPDEATDFRPLYERLDLAGEFHSCPNCGRLHWERIGGIQTFALDRELPRIWADVSDLDELGRVRLIDPRSQRDIARQHLLLEPPLAVVLYQDDGSEFPGEVAFGLGPDGEPDPRLWVVRLEEPNRKECPPSSTIQNSKKGGRLDGS
jgi:hypothetical protein